MSVFVLLSDTLLLATQQEKSAGATIAIRIASSSRHRLNNLLGEENWDYKPLITFSAGKGPSVPCSEAIMR